MGIANDIRPRHSAGRGSKTEPEQHTAKTILPEKNKEPEVSKVKLEAGATSSLLEPVSSRRRQLEDQFFCDLPKNKDAETIIAKPKERGSKTAWIILFWLMIFTAVIGYALYQNYAGLFKTEEEATGTSGEQSYTGEIATQDEMAGNAAVESTPAENALPAQPAIDKSQVTVKILNGNGVRGSAQSVSQTISQAGFKVAGVSNASNFNHAKTTIYYQTGKESEANLVKDALSGRETELTLSDTVTGGNNIVVVVGAK